MGSWTGFLFTYLLGGLTFIPLVLVVVLAHAYYTFPYREDVEPIKEDEGDSIVQPGDDLTALEAAKAAGKEDTKSQPTHQHDVAAGYFAVCREYTPMGINAKPIERATPVGSATVAAPSQSVYQTMYRSIFDRKQTPGPLDTNGTSQRPKKAGNVFYVVLRHGHLMLFDDDEQLEVRHVVSLAHHDISIYSGGDLTPEGELFIKRNALCLSRRRDGPEVGPDSKLSKPFYLFSENCSAKEDFYFSLLRNQEQTIGADRKSPKPIQFEVKNIISLVQKLHSSEEHIQTRWLNALLGRIFLGIYKTKDLEHFIREKITKKISRVKRPTFLTGISIQRIDTGESAPFITNLRHKDLNVEGECVVEADMRYTGNARIEVAATARIDLGSRFKVREVNLVLAVVLRKLEGHVLFKIKPPPSNRIWFSFQTMPKLEMTIEPIVSSRQITYTLILRQIENRIKEVFAETLVHPYWDDIPFFNTEHKKWRGGIWEDDDAVLHSPSLETNLAEEGDVDAVDQIEEHGEPHPDTRPIEKSYSLPIVENVPHTGLFGRKIHAKLAHNPLTTGSTTSVDSNQSSTSIPRTMRSNSATTPSEPVVGTDPTHADVFKPSSPPDHAASMIAALSARSQGNSPAHTPVGSPSRPSAVAQAASQSSSSSRETTDTEKDNESTPVAQGRRNTASSSESASHEEAQSSNSPASTRSSIKSHTGSITKGFFLRRENTSTSTSSASTNNDANQKRNTLAAVTNAAAQAKQWGWSALQRHKDGTKNGTSEEHPPLDLNQPMGRGRPLPPPGTPLPPPDRKSKVTSIPVPKRKSVPSSNAPERPKAIVTEESNPERRSAPPSLLPKRRLLETDNSNEENMLVVAAPMDSEPTTPLSETSPSYMRPWAEDAVDERHVNSHPVQDESHTDSHQTDEGDIETPPATSANFKGETEPVQHAEKAEEAEQTDSGENSPITAMPVHEPEEDDDDYSNWMDNTEADDEQPNMEVPEERDGNSSDSRSLMDGHEGHN